MKSVIAIFSWMIFMCGPAEARVFDMNNEKFASYFLVTGGPSGLKQAAFLNEANAAYTYDKKVDFNYTGEFGFLYATPRVSLRFGFEIFKPQMLTDITASNAGTAVYTLSKSDFTMYAPKLGVEMNIHQQPTYRAFILAYVGAASMTYKNEYASHTEEGKGTGTLYGGSFGYEGLMTDTTTFLFEAGYRSLNITNGSYASAVASGIDGASHAAGDPLKDITGEQRNFDFGGLYLSLGFRFYL